MESTSWPSCCQLSATTVSVALEQGYPPEMFTNLGERPIKGKGLLQTYLLNIGDWEAVVAREAAARAEALAACAARTTAELRRSVSSNSPGAGSSPRQPSM